MNGLEDENVEWYRWLEKRVCVKGTLLGTLKYFGTTKFCDGLWCGIQLDEPVGKNDGSVNSVKYFTCLPNFGIFVPVSKVCKIKNDIRNLSFTHLNGTFEVQNCQDTTILISSSDSKSCNDNKDIENIGEIKNHCDKKNEEMGETKSHSDTENGEINEAKMSKELNTRQDSEESLGLLDPNLIDSLTTSWDSLSLDAAAVGDIVKDSVSKLISPEIGFPYPSLPPVNSFFPDEISNPKYASTPRHPVKKRIPQFSDIDEIDFRLQNIEKNNDVFENQINCEPDVFFDFEKLKHNPDLSSTSKILTTLPDTNMNIVSPVQNNIVSPVQNNIVSPVQNNIVSPVQNNIVSPVQNNIVSPIQNGNSSYIDLNKTQVIPSSYPIDLNKTQVIPSAFISSQGIMPISMDLNKTQTFQNGCETNVSNIDVLSTTFKMPMEPQSKSEDKDDSPFQKTFVLGSSLSEDKHSNIEEAVDILNDVVQVESFDYKNKFLEETVILEKSLSCVNVGNNVNLPVISRTASTYSKRLSNNFDLNSTFHKKGKAASNASIHSNNRKSVASVQHTTSNADKKVAEFKKPLSIYSSIRKPKPKAPLKHIASTVPKETENSSHSRERISLPSDMSPVFNANMKNNATSVEQEKENRQIKNESLHCDKSLVTNINSKNRMSSIDVKSKKGRLSASFDLDNKLKNLAKVAAKSKYSRRISYSQGTESTELLNTTSDLPLPSKDKGTSKSSSKIFLPSSTALPSKVQGISKVALNSVKNTMLAKQTINKASNGLDNKAPMSRLKEPGMGNKLPVSRLSLGISSKGNGIPRRNSLAASSKTNLPIGIIKPRYSYLPSIEEKNLLYGKNIEPFTEQPAKSSKNFVPEAVPTVVKCTTVNSNKSSRIASSLPPKSQIVTRKIGQKYSDVKEESGASTKIARYNLREKK